MAILIWLWQRACDWAYETWRSLIAGWRKADRREASAATPLAFSRTEQGIRDQEKPPPTDPDFEKIFTREMGGGRLLGLNLCRGLTEAEILAAIVARGWAPVKPPELEQLFAGPTFDLPLGWYHAFGLTTVCQAWPGALCHFCIAKFEGENGALGQNAFWVWNQHSWLADPREIIVVRAN